jgi:hypothetical protein
MVTVMFVPGTGAGTQAKREFFAGALIGVPTGAVFNMVGAPLPFHSAAAFAVFVLTPSEATRLAVTAMVPMPKDHFV